MLILESKPFTALTHQKPQSWKDQLAKQASNSPSSSPLPTALLVVAEAWLSTRRGKQQPETSPGEGSVSCLREIKSGLKQKSNRLGTMGSLQCFSST